MINFKELYALQADLDAEIAKNHGTTYETTFEKRLLALIVEIGELANETRCFKYWSNKPMSPKEVVLDEFADGIHFLLSLGIPLNANKMDYEITKPDCDLTHQIHLVYKAATELLTNYDLEHYEDCFQKYLNIIALLGYSEEDVIDSYKKKLNVNHKRQETNY